MPSSANLAGPPKTLVENKPAAVAVADALRRTILNGDAAGGDRLRQDHIATEFGVSQMIVREAFKQLVAEGFLNQEPRRGVSVAPLNVDDAREMTQLRALLECQALEWAIPNQSPHEIEAARQLLNDLDSARSTDDILVLNARFHETLYAPARRDRTLRLINSLRLNFERYLRFTWDKTPHRAQSQSEHREILSLCQGKKVDKACAVLRRHIHATGALLLKAL